MQEGDGEQSGQDVEGHYSDKDDTDKDRVIEWKPICPTGEGKGRYQNVSVRPSFA